MEADSDTEDDPTKLLNQWLGELNTLKKGLDNGVSEKGDSAGGEGGPAGKGGNGEANTSAPHIPEMKLAEKKKKYRCSLINLETSQDEELDAILGELTVLESQFDQEIQVAEKRQASITSAQASPSKLKVETTIATPQQPQQQHLQQLQQQRSPVSPADSDRSSSNMTDLGIHSNSASSHSRSSSGSDEIKQAHHQLVRRHDGAVGGNAAHNPAAGGGRTESPDTDSAFCDNLSMLSSCSAASSNKTGGDNATSVSLPSSVQAGRLTKEEQDAKIKAEKIKIAIEKIKEASVKKLFIKVFTSDGSAKSLLVDEKMSVGQVTRILIEKNHVQLDPKWALVELVPDLYMERVYEDHEQLVENCLLWKVDSKNTLWFIERPEKFDLFVRPEVYLLGTSSSQRDDSMEEHSRQELLEEYFNSSGVGAPELEGTIWLKQDSKKSWKRFYFVLRTSGLYYAPKGNKKSSSKDLVCLTTFDVNQVYYGVGWRNKYKAPTEFCFGVKHPQIQAKNPKYIKYLCVDTQRELHQWVTAIRIAKNGRNLFDNYRGIVEEMTHVDIDILTSKRFSVNSTSGLHIPQSSSGVGGIPDKLTGTCIGGAGGGIHSPVRTPSSENKSLASALSSGIESDLSNTSTANSATSNQDQTGGCIASDMHNNDLTDKHGHGEERVDEQVEDTDFSGGSSTAATSNGATAGLTPVGTLDRSFKLRRSFSRSSKSSSSSGCLSDKSAGGGACSAGGAELLGFESDFPVGGTIKKRPATTATGNGTPRLPLTSTTWGLVRESDQEDDEAVAAESCDSGSDGVDGGGAVVGLGAGGTLLRKAVRNSLTRKPTTANTTPSTGPVADMSSGTPPDQRLHPSARLNNSSPAPPTRQTTHSSAQSKPSEDPLSSAFERSLSSMSEDEGLEGLPLPPPPRMDSITSLDSIDQLPPPPPPDDYYEAVLPAGIHNSSNNRNIESNHYHVSPVTSPSEHCKSIVPGFGHPYPHHSSMVGHPVLNAVPAPGGPVVNGRPPPSPAVSKLPPASPKPPVPNVTAGCLAGKKSGSDAPGKVGTALPTHKSSRRISFDDNVQMIEAPSTPSKSMSPARFSPAPSNPQSAVIQHPALSANAASTGGIVKFSPIPPVRLSPGRLNFQSDEDSAADRSNTNSLPRSFLADLQRVMNKKWKVSEKCRTERDTTPHEVLGFRDEPIAQLGQPGLYSQNNAAIGAWVLNSQQYAPEEMVVPDDPPLVYDQHTNHNNHNHTHSHNHNHQPYSQVLPHYQSNQQQIIQQPHVNQQLQHQQPNAGGNHGYSGYNGSPHHHPNHHHTQPHSHVHHAAQTTPAYSHYGQYNSAHQHSNGQQHNVSPYQQQAHHAHHQPHQHLHQHHQSPVVLIEPEPNYVDPSRMRANKQRPPPPPRRSENTQLTAGGSF